MFDKKPKIKKRFLKTDDIEKLDRIFARHSDKVGYKIVDEKAVILNLENNSYFSLNDVGAQIWQSLKEDKNLAQIVRETADIFEIGYKKASYDLIELVNELVNADLLGIIIVDDYTRKP